jgi:endonuclease-3
MTLSKMAGRQAAAPHPTAVSVQAFAKPMTSDRPFATKAARAAYIERRLAELYPETPIPLQHSDAYSLLVAVVLSAQCTDVRVNLVTPALWARAHTPESMSRLPVAEVQAIIRPCGLAPQKARAIVGLSRLLVERHGGQVPRSFAELETLPGVGHKTASVVMAQAFDEPAFPVDTHIHRLARRWRLSNGRSVEQTERDLKRLFLREHWQQLHLRMIFFGRQHCTARGCDGTVCEICRTLFPGRPASSKTAVLPGKSG